MNILKNKNKIINKIKENYPLLAILIIGSCYTFIKMGFLGLISLFISLLIIAIFWWVIMIIYYKLKDW